MSLNCLEATRLLSDRLDRPLDESSSAELAQHLEICPGCVECGLQFRLLRVIVQRWRERAHGAGTDGP